MIEIFFNFFSSSFPPIFFIFIIIFRVWGGRVGGVGWGGVVLGCGKLPMVV